MENQVFTVLCSSGIGRSSQSLLLHAAWAGGGVLQPQHGSGHASAVPGPKRGGGRRGARSNNSSSYECAECPSKVFKSPKQSSCFCPAESHNSPPQLPPRNFPLNEVKDSEQKSSDQACKSLSETYLMRLQYMDLSTYGHFCINTAHWFILWSSQCYKNKSANNLEGWFIC